MVVEIGPGDFANALGAPDDGTYDGQLVPRHKTPAERAAEVLESVRTSHEADPHLRIRILSERRRTPR